MKAKAEEYSFNIKSQLFPTLNAEQQKMWKQEIEQAYKAGFGAITQDQIEALHTEYEKGRADVIADTISWLANCWPQYCSNPTIIDGFKEAIKGE